MSFDGKLGKSCSAFLQSFDFYHKQLASLLCNLYKKCDHMNLECRIIYLQQELVQDRSNSLNHTPDYKLIPRPHLQSFRYILAWDGKTSKLYLSGIYLPRRNYKLLFFYSLLERLLSIHHLRLTHLITLKMDLAPFYRKFLQWSEH